MNRIVASIRNFREDARFAVDKLARHGTHQVVRYLSEELNP